MLIPINNVGQFGVISDTAAHKMPVNAWTDARNVRFIDNAVWRSFGQQSILGTPTVDPTYLYQHLGPSNIVWAYFDETTAHATDGATHGVITRAVGGDYSSGVWQGTHLGGIEIFNNGADIPQAWINPLHTTQLIDLANWPANTTAKVIKSFKQFLVALNITESGTNFPFLVKWSHVADPGTVPTSWDETDATLDAGEYPLAESGGHIQDALVLNDSLFIYKEDKTYIMRLIGGRFVFGIAKKLDFGMIAPRCGVEYKNKHYIGSSEDIFVHDGFQYESMLDNKMRKWYKNRADPAFLNNQYMIHNVSEDELWMCIPTAGQEFPDLALIVNMQDGTSTIKELDGVAHITSATFTEDAGATTFDDINIPFDEVPGKFGQRVRDAGGKRLIGAVHTPGKFLLYDEGSHDDGKDFTSYVERLSMPLGKPGRDGQPTLDPTRMKLINEVWPEFRANVGTRAPAGPTVSISVGAQNTLNEGIRWEGPYDFTIGVDQKVDFDIEGRYHSFRFETSDNLLWKLDGYGVNMEDLGAL